MRIKLGGWSARGLRCPDVDIDLFGPDGSPEQITLLQMPNGTGKTTTLELLKATLSGAADRWDMETIRTFRRPRETNERGQFTVNLFINERPLTIELTLDFERGQASYRTTKPGTGGIEERWSPEPPQLRRFLAPEFLSLFIFDGEFAERLLDPRHAEADKAVEALCGLYLLNDVVEFAEREWADRAKQSSTKSDSGLTRKERLLDHFRVKRAQLVKSKARAEKQVETLGAEVDELDHKIDDRLTNLAQVQYAEAKEELTRAEAQLTLATAETMQLIRQPLALTPGFRTWLTDLRDNLDALKLPENTSAQFFTELLEERECICGREMTEGARQEIAIRSRRYLDSAESGVINALKKDISDYTRPESDPTDILLTKQLDQLREARRERKGAQQAVSQLYERLVEGGAEELKNWQAERDQKRAELGEYEDHLRALAEDYDARRAEKLKDSPEDVLSLKFVERRIRELSEEIARITDTITFRRQTDVVKQIIQRARAIARVKIKEDLVRDSNERLRQVLANDPVEIAQIDRSLRLAHQATGSVGQVLAVGYVFLMSVLTRGANDFPLVVDSPANPIDRGRRRRVGAMIPELCSQFVGFMINTEYDAFVPAIARASNRVRYLTHFRKTTGTAPLISSLPSAGVTQSDTGVLVEGPDYFRDFELTSEDE